MLRHCTFLGQAHVKNKQFKFALKCFNEEVLLCESANALHSNIKISEAYYCAGIVNVEMGNHDRANESFKKVAEAKGKNESVHINEYEGWEVPSNNFMIS